MNDLSTQLQRLFTHSRDGFLALDGGKLLFFNHAAEHIFETQTPATILAQLPPPNALSDDGIHWIIQGQEYFLQPSRWNENTTLICITRSVYRKLPSLTQFCAILRSDLATYQLAAEPLLCEKELDCETRRQYRAMFYRSYYRLRRSIDSATTLEALDRGTLPFRPVSTELRDFCSSLCTTFSAFCEPKRPQLRWEAPACLLWAEVDQDLLERLLLHLLSNSLRHTPPDKSIRVSLEQQGDMAVISVVDHGEGSPPEQIAFTGYNFGTDRLTRLAEGLGLGLPIACGLAELHGGSLLVESTPGKGYQAHLRLPLTQSKPLSRTNQFRTPIRSYRPNGIETFRTELSTALPWECYQEEFMD